MGGMRDKLDPGREMIARGRRFIDADGPLVRWQDQRSACSCPQMTFAPIHKRDLGRVGSHSSDSDGNCDMDVVYASERYVSSYVSIIVAPRELTSPAHEFRSIISTDDCVRCS